MIRSAAFSDDGSQRWELIRDFADELTFSSFATVNFIMLNPSKAGDVEDDQSIRKCVGFARRWGFSRMVATNLIATVETDPWKLPAWSGIDRKNERYLKKWIAEADLLVAAWGAQPRAVAGTIALIEHVYNLQQIGRCKEFRCIGTTRNGAPRHPSRSPYTRSPSEFHLPTL